MESFELRHCRQTLAILVPMLLWASGCGAPKTAEPTPVVENRRNFHKDDDAPPPTKPQSQASEPEAPPKPRGPVWPEILGPAQGSRPAPRSELVWLTSLKDATELARVEKRPILVIARCPESKQFAALDEQIQNPSGETEQWLRQFITVRLTDAWDFDYRMLQPDALQDGDCSLWAWMLTESGAPLATFGGRDHEGDESRVSLSALRRTAERVLGYCFDPRRPDWNIDPKPPDLTGPAQSIRVALEPGYVLWKDTFRKGLSDVKCLRCHQAQEIVYEQRSTYAEFDHSRVMLVWPYPENIGMTLDRDDGLKVTAVRDASVAAKAGLQAGDVLGSANDRRLFSQSDLRAVLQSQPHLGGTLRLRWMRGEDLMEGTLQFPEIWREMGPEILAWRASLVFGPLGPVPGFYPKEVNDGVRKKLRIPSNTMAVEPQMTSDSPSARAGLKPNDIVVAVNGHRPPVDEHAFIVWFRRNVVFDRPTTLDVVNTRNGQLRKQIITPIPYRPTE
jgi:hypothetical protein